MKISAEVLADSINTTGDRLTTFRIVLPKFILAEFNTHRALSRNFSSSRAIPAKKMRSLVLANPVIPVHLGQNQKGMQAHSELSGWNRSAAKLVWLWARYPACLFHWVGEKAGLHKQICNRIIEPWAWAEGVVTATDWDNFFGLRCHKDAQPEFLSLATAMKEAINRSTPNLLKEGEWHLPFVSHQEFNGYSGRKVSAARCARVSYFLKDNSNKLSNTEADFALCDRLAGSNPKHLSPFEHQAMALGSSDRCANFIGWRQFRSEIENS